MSILLWVLQIVLAVLYVAGGAYKTSKAEDLVKQTRALSPGAWRAIGVIEILGGVLLIVPAAVTGMPLLIPLAATVLALETMVLAGIYARRSVKLVAANPFPWATAMAFLAIFVAYGRFALV
jgi:hypothetical protein